MNAAASYSLHDWFASTPPPKGWDAADAVEDGWTREDFKELAKNAAVDYQPPRDGQVCAKNALTTSGYTQEAPPPQPFKSKFGALHYPEIFSVMPDPEYLVKGVLTRGEISLLVGASQSGKSFFATDIALKIARGENFLPNARGEMPRTKRGGILYIAGESSRGLKNRLRAHDKHHGVTSLDVPYVLIPRPVGFAGKDSPINDLIQETLHYSADFQEKFGVGVELVVIDTFSSMTAGANENSSEDVSRILENMGSLARECNCAVMIVHHMNASGTRERGHSSLRANVDSVIEVMKTDARDVEGRVIRKAVITKQKDGEDGATWNFVLRQVALGVDRDGDGVTSCVVEIAAGDEIAESAVKRHRSLPRNAYLLYKHLEQAVKEYGAPPPHEVLAPPYTFAVTLQQWRAVIEPTAARENETPEELTARVIKAREKAIELFLTKNLIQKKGEYVWLTSVKPFESSTPPHQNAPNVTQQAKSYYSTKNGE